MSSPRETELPVHGGGHRPPHTTGISMAQVCRGRRLVLLLLIAVAAMFALAQSQASAYTRPFLRRALRPVPARLPARRPCPLVRPLQRANDGDDGVRQTIIAATPAASHRRMRTSQSQVK
jgi:hypothetical protein